MSEKQNVDNGFLEKTFKLKENGTNVRTEVLAGITTFMTMAYILIVNPEILSAAGMDPGAVFTATAISSIIATLVMAFYANYPFALAPGMGLNAFFAFGVVLGMGYTFQFALTAVLIEGIIFLILTFFNVRDKIVDAIPINLKHAISVGIGLFIAFIGLQNAGIIVPYEATAVTLGDMTSAPAIVAIIGIIITGVLLIKNVKGALLLGIIVATVISIPLGITSYNGFMSAPPSLRPIAFQFVGLSEIFSWDMVVVLVTFLIVDMMDTIGTLVGVASKTNILREDGSLPKAKQALFADAIGTTAGACLGTSTVTTYIESAAGVAEGGRTGLTALSTAGMFAVALLFSPILLIVPGAATAPALILVGLFMMSPIQKIDLSDYTEAIPVFLAIIMMPLAYSIAEGIIFGLTSYVFLKVLTGKARQVSPIAYVLVVIFIGSFLI